MSDQESTSMEVDILEETPEQARERYARKRRLLEEEEKKAQYDGLLSDDSDPDSSDYIPARQRKKEQAKRRELLQKTLFDQTDVRRAEEKKKEQLKEEKRKQAEKDKQEEEKKKTLVSQYNELKQKEKEENLTEQAKFDRQEEELLQNFGPQNVLLSANERASGIRYTDPIKTSWRPPKHLRDLNVEERNEARKGKGIKADGEDVPPMITTFLEMKLHKSIQKALKDKGMIQPTLIQMQGIPVALSGRDMIGIASTGSGKTLTFVLPLIQFCAEQEYGMPFEDNEGPYGLILVPSRELAIQIFDTVEWLFKVISESMGIDLKACLVIGGQNIHEQVRTISRGVHVIVATTGRMVELLNKRHVNLEVCRYLCLDEADRMLDLGFEEELNSILGKFKAQRQTLLFSATMPKKIQKFALDSLVCPVVVNVGRAGAASLNVKQELEYVRDEEKLSKILECLQKTAPKVLIFAERKVDVETIYEYLLLKGVDVVAIHGDKDQVERHEGIKAFKEGRKDVLVATDVASKGLDFENIRHVINYDMPETVENYVHRIGRTGRSKKRGLATTFFNRRADYSMLVDLKHLFIEAGQEIPSLLKDVVIDETSGSATNAGEGCAYCSGLGHRITNCPRLEQDKSKVVSDIFNQDFKRAEGI